MRKGSLLTVYPQLTYHAPTFKILSHQTPSTSLGELMSRMFPNGFQEKAEALFQDQGSTNGPTRFNSIARSVKELRKGEKEEAEE